ncbi:RagB/SusD family nutrient uptake outer membrane protein [Arundinibacter roseus]|uniref:RagB/SusD family nutrient uptake outer membrane protein n=1 Tax=Arundinibacter roseus TaxID=2070510 RepID=A0A4R4KC19_9BACT|nr:RagB/SusD family nutrient uptake outer membrane protein [Arundinibacter roseus]TDB65173.1 RagB/SusD family nutrient uptake outer membrane protein [Arundinibacter roseus]
MKHKLIASVSLAALLSLGSCKDSFLELSPYDALPAATAISTAADMGVAANGMYSGMRNIGLYGRTLPLSNDLMADNVYLSVQNSGRYLAQFNYSINSQNGDVTGTWNAGYVVILRANNIINSTVAQSTESDQFRGEALTARALMYFELVRAFAKPYTVDANAPGVPIVLEFDPLLKPARNSVQEVYAQIISDLNQAFGLMTNTSKNSSYFTKYVAKALLSKVYFYMGDYPKAIQESLAVVNEGGYKLVPAADYGAYYRNPAPVANKVETIFEVASDGTNNAGFDALVNMYAQAGYGDALVADDLFGLYADTDIRKSVIIPGTRAGESVNIVNKYQNIANADDKDDTKVLRYAEILLQLAESYARTGDETNALNYLNQVAQTRDSEFLGFTSTGAELLEDIITERRKELAFEGNRFADLNRLGRAITRNEQFPAAARTVELTDSRRQAPIPQVELDANKNINQNPGY